eukprot:721180-Pyramimonas_sp.AAC.1
MALLHRLPACVAPTRPFYVVPAQKAKVEAFKGTIPVIASLRNKNLKERHWEKIEEIIAQPVVRDDTFTLNKLMDMQVMNFAEDIAVVSTEATQEGVLEEMLAKMFLEDANTSSNLLKTR